MAITDRKRMYEVVEVNGNKELDFLQTRFTEMELSTNKSFRIPQALQFRPDLISYKFYGNFHMGWLICLHNDMLDPINDFYEGRLIEIPSIEQYYRYYARFGRTGD